MVSGEKITYWSANFILPNSLSLYSFIKEKKLINPIKLNIIGNGSSNGIDINRFNENNLNKKRIYNIKKKINYNKENYYLLAIGRLVKDKGIIELVNVFIKLNKNNKRLKLLLLGPFESVRKDETLPLEIKNQIKNNPNITQIDWVDDVEYYLNFSNLFIHCSHREGFPNVVLQSGLMNCPVLCSDIPGNIDIISNKKNGLCFEVNNETDLEKKILYIINNKKNINKYVKKLRIEIIKNYSRGVFHQNLLNFYNKKLKFSI